MGVSTWLALLALGVQLALPLSIGTQIAHRGAAPMWKAAADDLCSAVHPRAIPADDHANAASHRGNDGSGPSSPASGCALCAALGAMHAFTDAPALTLPIPVRTEPNRSVAMRDAAFAGVPFSVYRSRAPPAVT